MNRCHLGERTAIVRVRCISPDAAGRAARHSLATSLRTAGRDDEMGHFVEDSVCQKGKRDIVFRYRKAPETRNESL